jgi:hypothetical protein
MCFIEFIGGRVAHLCGLCKEGILLGCGLSLAGGYSPDRQTYEIQIENDFNLTVTVESGFMFPAFTTTMPMAEKDAGSRAAIVRSGLESTSDSGGWFPTVRIESAVAEFAVRFM